MISIKEANLEIQFEESAGHFTVKKGNVQWNQLGEYDPVIEYEGGAVRFADAEEIAHEIVENGIGRGIRSTYGSFVIDGRGVPYKFETYVWIESATGDVFFEWVPLCEEGIKVKKICWPAPFDFDQKKEEWYTLLNMQQGILLPNTWKEAVKDVVMEGYFQTAGSYMPWYAQVKGRDGYIAICTTPWNAGCYVDHPAEGPYTHVGTWYESSHGCINYRRVMRYTFLSDCDYNDICKIYRTYVKEQGKLRTLAEKAVQLPSVDNLIGCSFIHTGIRTYVREDSDFFDAKNPEKNNNITTFAQREAEIHEIHRLGMEKVYMHLDGWFDPGYDNWHPEHGDICEEAGGEPAMRSLADAMHEYGYLFGIHDQYRDYYFAGPTFDEDYACRLTDGSIPKHQKWAGGPQSYLCGTQAPYYVRKNFEDLEKRGIHLDGAYLDVFTCNEADECNNPRHKMSRRECYEARANCFSYLMAKGILPSSEEASDWSIPSMVFCHYAPYDFMMKESDAPRIGVPVPLFGLVYHDCLIVPWIMDKVGENDDYMLYALLNGGAPYLKRDGAYPNTDGSFEPKVKFTMEESIERCRIVAGLHEQVAKCEMVRHEMVNGDYQVQKTVFADGTSVTVDFREQTYSIDRE